MIKNACLTVLIEDSLEKKDKKGLAAKHGLSVLVEGEVNDAYVRVLMDSGPSAEALLNNVDVLGVNLRKIDAVLLSHGHYDHTDGLISVLKNINKFVPVIAHPKIFSPKFSTTRGKLRFIGAAFTQSELRNYGGIPLFARNPVSIAKGITTTGEIERVTSYERVTGFFTVEHGQFIKDDIIDDQALILNLEGKGLVVVTGCAHAGVVNTVLHAQKIMKTKKVYAVLGGFHLVDASKERIKATIEDLKKFDIKFLGPCHCTGKKALKTLKEAFGDKCRILKTGDVIKF